MAPLKDVSASEKTVKKRMKEMDIDLVFEAMDDLVTQNTCKTCKLFALANMALNFILLGIALKGSLFLFSCKIVHA